jgi:hypothetical protein
MNDDHDTDSDTDTPSASMPDETVPDMPPDAPAPVVAEPAMPTAPDPDSAPVLATPPSRPALSSVGQMPVAPPRPLNMRALLLAGVALVVLGAALGVFFIVRANNQPTDASTLLARASQANLRDGTFNVTGSVSVGIAGEGISEPVSGNGTIIRSPYKLHITENVAGLPTTGPISLEEIIIGDTAYLKLPASLGGNAQKPWTQTTVAPTSALPSLALTDFLNYSTLQRPMNLGTETINGHATWHIHADLIGSLTGGPAATATAISSASGSTTQASEDLWIRQDNYFPAQVMLHTTFTSNLGSKSVIASVSVNATLTLPFTAWNTGVAIDPPPPDQVQG